MSHLGIDSGLFWKMQIDNNQLGNKNVHSNFLWVPETSCMDMSVFINTCKTHPFYLPTFICMPVKITSKSYTRISWRRLRFLCFEGRGLVLWNHQKPAGYGVGRIDSWWWLCHTASQIWDSHVNSQPQFLPDDVIKHTVFGCCLADENNTVWVRKVLYWGVASFWLPPSNRALPAFQMSDESCADSWGCDTGDQSGFNYLNGMDDKSAFWTYTIQVKTGNAKRTEIAPGYIAASSFNAYLLLLPTSRNSTSKQ